MSATTNSYFEGEYIPPRDTQSGPGVRAGNGVLVEFGQGLTDTRLALSVGAFADNYLQEGTRIYMRNAGDELGICSAQKLASLFSRVRIAPDQLYLSHRRLL